MASHRARQPAGAACRLDSGWLPHLWYWLRPLSGYSQNTAYRDGFDVAISHNEAQDVMMRRTNVFGRRAGIIKQRRLDIEHKTARVAVFIGVSLSALAVLALGAQDKYTVKVPNGLAFSEFKGYEDWQSVGPSQTDAQNVMRLIL